MVAMPFQASTGMYKEWKMAVNWRILGMIEFEIYAICKYYLLKTSRIKNNFGG